LEPVLETQDGQIAEAKLVRELVARHLALTGSPRAASILDNWSEMLSRFIKVFPHEHKRVLGLRRRRPPYNPSPPLAVPVPAEQVRHG
jgi:glutamate synthase domain-containing protein 3